MRWMLKTLKSRSLQLLIGGAGILLSSLLFVTLPSQAVVRLSTDHHQQSCFIKAEYFTLRWIHSVEGTPWQEQYQHNGSRLLLTTTEFTTYGAGTPDSGALIKSDHTLAYTINRELKELYWIVSRNVRSTLIIGGASWPLYRELPDYSEVQFIPMKVSLWDYYKKEDCYVNALN